MSSHFRWSFVNMLPIFIFWFDFHWSHLASCFAVFGQTLTFWFKIWSFPNQVWPFGWSFLVLIGRFIFICPAWAFWFGFHWWGFDFLFGFYRQWSGFCFLVWIYWSGYTFCAWFILTRSDLLFCLYLSGLAFLDSIIIGQPWKLVLSLLASFGLLSLL